MTSLPLPWIKASLSGTYRPDVDFLRALAALAVVAFHAGWLPGGGAGVDIFFVISGFLISGIILRSIDAGQFSFIDFYARRVNRLFPALVFLLVVVVFASSCVLSPEQRDRVAIDSIASAVFIENIWMYFSFSDRTQTSDWILSHLWTLGIEEQFYLLWPVFLFIGAKLKERLSILVGATLLMSLTAYAWMLSKDTTAALYLPWNRLWELALGSMLACAQTATYSTSRGMNSSTVAQSADLTPRWLSLSSTIGVICLVVSLAGLIPLTAWWGFYAFIPAIGTYLLIAAGSRNAINQRFFNYRPMAYLGKLSYPLYLWHMPVFMLAAILHGRERMSDHQDIPATTKIIAFSVSLIMSHVTYKYLESPFRATRRTRSAAIVLLVLMACFGGVAYWRFH